MRQYNAPPIEPDMVASLSRNIESVKEKLTKAEELSNAAKIPPPPPRRAIFPLNVEFEILMSTRPEALSARIPIALQS
jgi:hypothetical protein